MEQVQDDQQDLGSNNDTTNTSTNACWMLARLEAIVRGYDAVMAIDTGCLMNDENFRHGVQLVTQDIKQLMNEIESAPVNSQNGRPHIPKGFKPYLVTH